jgi:predicted ATPase/DNA-binding SARP family transcriptional activator
MIAAQLPLQLTSFVGREREIARVREVLARARLITLTGAGGSGKTRLALEVASQTAQSYPDGASWVDLVRASDPTQVSAAVATALGIREEPNRTPAESVIAFLQPRDALLILDNCEHVVDAAAALAEDLLRHCPCLRLIATSREALGIAGEVAWHVPALALPDGSTNQLDIVAEAEAVRLFIERARDAAPGFALTNANAPAVQRICRRLDGIPLALELAAARLRVLAPEQIATRLEEDFRLLASSSRTAIPRHRTLRATIDWSYALLTDHERFLLQRLSVFVRSFSLEAAEAVCAARSIGRDDILDLLSALVDKSLVLMDVSEGEARYHLLETVRQYAADRLAESAYDDDVREHHAKYFVHLAETAAPHLFGGATDAQWIDLIRSEMPNFRAAADWAEADDSRAEIAQRLAASLMWPWFAFGSFREARQRLTAAISQGRGGNSSPFVRGRALAALGWVLFWQAEYTEMRAPLEESLPLLRKAGNAQALMVALAGMGMTLSYTGEVDAAEEMYAEAVALSRTMPGTFTTFALYMAGSGAFNRGDVERAGVAYSEGLAIGRRLGFIPAIAHHSIGMGRVTRTRGDYDSALGHFSEALTALRKLRDRWAAAQVIELVASVAIAQNESLRAAQLLGAAEAIRESLGAPVPRLLQEEHSRMVAHVRTSLPPAALEAAWSAGRAFTLDEALHLATGVPVETTPPPAAQSPAPAPAAVAPTPAVAETAPAYAAPARVPALRVLALGPLEIYVEGQPLDADAWRYAKPRELMLYLLCHREGRTREQIGLDLWPDASGAQVRNNFHVAMHRVRKVLEHAEWLVLEQDRYRFDPALDVELDARVFDTEATAALRELRAGKDASRRLADALALYRGDFLEGEMVGDWHVQYCDQLRRLYVDGQLALGAAHLAAERYAEAAEMYERIVHIEDLNEEAYRRLMVCRARLGDRTQALRLYQKLTILLRDELDAEPESETTELFQRLQSEQRA